MLLGASKQIPCGKLYEKYNAVLSGKLQLAKISEARTKSQL
jgi:hypothetical protein